MRELCTKGKMSPSECHWFSVSDVNLIYLVFGVARPLLENSFWTLKVKKVRSQEKYVKVQHASNFCSYFSRQYQSLCSDFKR